MSHPPRPPGRPAPKVTPTTSSSSTSATSPPPSSMPPPATPTIAPPSSSIPTIGTPPLMSRPPPAAVPSLAPPRVISAPCAPPKSVLITHTYDLDRQRPRFGQLIKIRLDQPISGPGSSQISASAPSRTTVYNYHSAVVLAVSNDLQQRCLTVTVFPIPAYTGARFLGTTSDAWVAQLPLEKRRALIPMPFIGGPQDATRDAMPEGFGDPVRPRDASGNRYADRIPSWILMDTHVVRLPWSTVWKSFNPDVNFPTADLDRLQAYANNLQSLPQNTNNLRVNMVHIPEEYARPWGVFEELFGDFHSVMQYVSENGVAQQALIEGEGNEYL